MKFIKAFLYYLKETGLRPVTALHGIVYTATATYLRVLSFLMRRRPQSFRDHMAETYFGKVVKLDDAAGIITINRDLELRNLETVLPHKAARDIILKNPHNIVAYECACRAQQKNPCSPTDVCLIIGEPFVDLIRTTQPFRSRRISMDEALEILKQEDDRGHLHTAWFKTVLLNRFYAICNCCKCCCLGMKFTFEYKTKTLLPSGYRAVINDDCLGCGRCSRFCQFEAIELLSSSENGHLKKAAVIDAGKCFGCGVCEGKCETGNISLVLDETKGIPLDIEALARTAGQEPL